MLTLAVASGKGGVGKSTIAALLALAWKSRGAHVALLDTDIFGPSIPILFGVQEQRHTFDAQNRILPIRTHDIELASFGCIIGEMPAVMRGPMVARYTDQLLTQVAWHDPDILILDLPPGTGDIHLTIGQTIALNGALLVSTPHALSFSDVGKAILMFNKIKVPILGIIENMAYFECATCNSREYLFGEDADSILKRKFGIRTLTSLPLSRKFFGIHPLHNTIHPDLVTLTDTIQHALAQEAQRPIPQIKNTRDGIYIAFGKEAPLRVSHLALRNACQCALCVDEHNHRRISPPVSGDVCAQEVRLVGNYALYIKWSDGHATGFFPLDQITALAHSTPVPEVRDG